MHATIDGIQWVLHSKEDWIKLFQWLAEHPDSQEGQAFYHDLIEGGTYQIRSWYDEWYKQQELLQQAESSGDWNSFYRDAAHQGVEYSDAIEKYVDNQIAQQNTEQAQDYEKMMRDTQYLSTGSQLQQLGLSPSIISATGATSSGVAAADNVMGSRSMDRQHLSMQKYQTRMGMAKGILGMVSQMASSGIYGAAIGSARNAAAKLSTAAAHSGLEALRKMRPELRNQLMKDEAARNTHYAAYQEY